MRRCSSTRIAAWPRSTRWSSRRRATCIVLDAKIDFDDNALFRHPDIEELRDETEENPAELRAAKAGLSFISLTATSAAWSTAPAWR